MILAMGRITRPPCAGVSRVTASDHIPERKARKRPSRARPRRRGWCGRKIRHDFRQRTDQRRRDKAEISGLRDGRCRQFAPGMAAGGPRHDRQHHAADRTHRHNMQCGIGIEAINGRETDGDETERDERIGDMKNQQQLFPRHRPSPPAVKPHDVKQGCNPRQYRRYRLVGSGDPADTGSHSDENAETVIAVERHRKARLPILLSQLRVKLGTMRPPITITSRT